MSKLHETLKAREYFDGKLEEILGDRLTSEVRKKLRTLLYEARHHCGSCGEPRSGDCITCERLWSS